MKQLLWLKYVQTRAGAPRKSLEGDMENGRCSIRHRCDFVWSLCADARGHGGGQMMLSAGKNWGCTTRQSETAKCCLRDKYAVISSSSWRQQMHLPRFASTWWDSQAAGRIRSSLTFTREQCCSVTESAFFLTGGPRNGADPHVPSRDQSV